MSSKEPFWMRVVLELDREETEHLRKDQRQIVWLLSGQAPHRAQRALLESLDDPYPRRIFIYSKPVVSFGRAQTSNEAVLRFLPDFYGDERSKTISAEQMVVQFTENQFQVALAPKGRAPTAIDGKILGPDEKLPLADGTEILIGTANFKMTLSCIVQERTAHWERSRDAIRRSDPGDDLFGSSQFDAIRFIRVTNGTEEEYVLLPRRLNLGWSREGGLLLGLQDRAGARLSYWNQRFYLEPFSSESEIKVDNRALQQGEVACLGSDSTIFFADFRFRWRLI
jgi:hypothetical protein